jgi:hypothetical protein
VRQAPTLYPASSTTRAASVLRSVEQVGERDNPTLQALTDPKIGRFDERSAARI